MSTLWRLRRWAMAAMLLASAFGARPALSQEDAQEASFGIDSIQAIEQTMACVDCFDWKITGICFWLRCTLVSCSVEESILVDHFTPDLMVATYSVESALEELRDLDLNPVEPGTIADDHGFREGGTNLDFKHAEVFANPAILVANETLGQTDYYCRSPIEIPYVPYFLSGLDPFWRDAAIERLLPQSWLTPTKIRSDLWLPGLGWGYWGQEFPRSGWGNHPADPIAAAVAAHRALHIVSRSNQLHVYMPPSTDCGRACEGPGELTADVDAESYDRTRFQMLFPVAEDDAKAFGGDPKWANGKGHPQQSYLWSVWRRYECCEPKGALITKIRI